MAEKADPAAKAKGLAKTNSPSHWQIVFRQAVLTPAIIEHNYKGSGTEEDPYLVEFIENDPANAMTYSEYKKWALTLLTAFATLAVAFVSSAYAGGVREILKEFEVSTEIVTLGISLFVLGFAIGMCRKERSLRSYRAEWLTITNGRYPQVHCFGPL